MGMSSGAYELNHECANYSIKYITLHLIQKYLAKPNTAGNCKYNMSKNEDFFSLCSNDIMTRSTLKIGTQ